MINNVVINKCSQVIFRSLKFYLESTQKTSLRHLYVQMDNARPNKSYVVIAAMAALVLLGIVKKVKLSYLMTGHSHTFGDGVIGNVGSQVIQHDMVTFGQFKRAVEGAFVSEGGHVFQLIGITDYKTMFEDIKGNPHNIAGNPKLLQISAILKYIFVCIYVVVIFIILIILFERDISSSLFENRRK